jgi:hypothetical protein
MLESCRVCQLDLFVVSKIRSKYLEGADLEDISTLFDLSLDDIREHCHNCIKRPKSTQARYKDIIEKLEDDIELVRANMSVKGDDGESENTIPALVQGYARLISEYKDSIVKLEALTKPEDQVKDTIIQVINPLIKDVLRNITEETSKLKGEMRVSGIQEDIILKLLEDFFKRIALKLKKSSDDSVSNLKVYFGADSYISEKE